MPTERDFQRQVVQLARLMGWRIYHTHDSRRSAAGFPDLVLVHPHRGIIFAELKSPTGRTTPEQEGWLALLLQAGQRAYLWRPEDLPAIAAVLGGSEVQTLAPPPR